jgi:hypothetical protein
MAQRVEALRSAVTIVQPALDKFYGLLTDEQKAKITALAADQQPASRGFSEQRQLQRGAARGHGLAERTDRGAA